VSTEGSKATVKEYLSGQHRAFEIVDAWIRTELISGFPMLGGEIEDLCQTIHGKLLVTFRQGSFRFESSLKTFVVRIARYSAVDHLRKTCRDPLWASLQEGAVIIPEDNPYLSLVSLEKGQFLRQILILSPRECRELWALAFLDQLGYQEIGRRMSISPGTVKSRMSRCRQRLLVLMRRLGGRKSGLDH
jgi:RNA polymerase sigma factor (sigma-70 family)